MSAVMASRITLAIAPHTPPPRAQAANDCEQNHDRDRAQYRGDRQPDDLIAEPRSEGLRRESVVVLPNISLVQGERKLEDGRDEKKGNEVQKRLEILAGGQALRPLTDAGRKTALQQPEHNRGAHQEVPKLQPVSTLKIG